MVTQVPKNQESIDVSAIIITRNEEANIADVTDSLLNALSHAQKMGALKTYEVIMVDSASTDRTVEIASRFPIGIVRLRGDWPLSASAGRATGARFATGRHLLFVDGDYLVDAQWLPLALKLIEQPRVGQVGGVDLEEIRGDTVLTRRWTQAQATTPPATVEVDTLAVGLVRRDAYAAIGGFHPFLRGAEDRDFCYRLQAAGWRILRTKEPMGVHRWYSAGVAMTYVEYYRSVATWSVGEGQACRARWSDDAIRRRFLRQYGTARYLIQDLQFLAFLGVLLTNALGAIVDGIALLVVVAADAAVLLAIDAWRRGPGWTWRETLFELQGAIYGPFRQVLFALGMLARSPPPERYPTDVEFVKPVTRAS